MAYAPHQQRVVDEKSELDEKLQKLSDFRKGSFCATLPTDEKDRLSHQQQTMETYSQILSDRIAHFA